MTIRKKNFPLFTSRENQEEKSEKKKEKEGEENENVVSLRLNRKCLSRFNEEINFNMTTCMPFCSN